MVLTPNDLFSWNNKYSKYTIILLHIHYNEFTSRFPAMHVNSLCACWHFEAMKESSSSSSRHLLISLWVTSSLSLCPEPTDAPCHCYGARPPPFPIWHSHSQGQHTLPYLIYHLQVCFILVKQRPSKGLINAIFHPD
jgi:hypothetical protein